MDNISFCDSRLKAQLFTLPSENEVAEWFAIIDPIAIHNVINFIIQKFATEMAAEFVAVYHANKMTEYRIDHGDIAKRSLRNRCLFYLAFGHDKKQADKYVTEQYYQANNMTDTMAAQLPSCQQLMAEFEQRWRHDGLIMDKWFMLQATSPAKNVLSTEYVLYLLIRHLVWRILIEYVP